MKKLLITAGLVMALSTSGIALADPVTGCRTLAKTIWQGQIKLDGVAKPIPVKVTIASVEGDYFMFGLKGSIKTDTTDEPFVTNNDACMEQLSTPGEIRSITFKSASGAITAFDEDLTPDTKNPNRINDMIGTWSGKDLDRFATGQKYLNKG